MHRSDRCCDPDRQIRYVVILGTHSQEGAKSIQDLYSSKRMPAADAVGVERDGDFIIVPTGVGEPPARLTALSDRRLDLRDVKVAQIFAVRKHAYFDPQTVEHLRHVAFFYGRDSRLRPEPRVCA